MVVGENQLQRSRLVWHQHGVSLGRLGLGGQSTEHQPSAVPPNKSDKSQGIYKVPAGKQAPGIALSECADWGCLKTSG